MKKQKVATAVTCCALVGAIAIGGTLALLSTGPKTLTNTFTAGANYEDGDFLLKEHGVDPVITETTGYPYGSYQKNGTVIDGDSTGEKGNTYGEIVPGTVLDKDPWFELAHGGKKTPDSWIVARLSKTELYDLQQKGITIEDVADADTSEAQWQIVTRDEDGDWTVGDGGITKETFTVEEYERDYIYFIFDRKLVDNGEGDKTTELFTKLAAGENAVEVNDLHLTVQGVAVQALSDEDALLSNPGTINAIMEQALGAWPTPLVG